MIEFFFDHGSRYSYRGVRVKMYAFPEVKKNTVLKYVFVWP